MISRRDTLWLAAGGIAAATVPAIAALPDDPADGHLFRRLIAAVRARRPDLAAQLAQAFPELEGTAGRGAAITWQDRFLFVFHGDTPPLLSVNDGPAVPMTRAGDGAYWFRLQRLGLGRTHNYRFLAGGRTAEGSVAGFGPDSQRDDTIPRGTLGPMHSVASALYGGAVSDFWLYCNHGVDPGRAAPLMIWLDGAMHVGARDFRNFRLQAVSDKLVHRRKIPPMVHLLLQPGRGGPALPAQFAGQAPDNATRSLQYDTFSPLFCRHIREEVLPLVERQVKLRQDPYSRGAAGQSSGALAAFKLGWFCPDSFSRVHATIGSFTGLGDDLAESGFTAPLRIRREPRRNLRIWLSDGAGDIDLDESGRPDLYHAGSWPLANIAVAQALKGRLYDYHFRFGDARHDPAQGGLDLPQSLAWLWRDYDPGKSEQLYEQDAAERARPAYRVRISNRPSW